MQHKSMKHYSDILINTLRDDYNIPVTVIDMDGEKDDPCGVNMNELNSEMTRLAMEKTRALQEDPACTQLITDSQAEELSQTRQPGTTRISEIEEQQLWVYHMILRYRIPLDAEVFSSGRQLSSKFINDYVKTYSPNREILAMFYRLKRLDHMVWSDTRTLEAIYNAKITAIHNMPNSDMEMHHTKAHKMYRPAILLSKLLYRLDANWAAKFSAAVNATDDGTDSSSDLMYTMDQFKETMIAWTENDVDDGLYNDLLDKLDIPRRSDVVYGSRQRLLRAMKGNNKANLVASGHFERLLECGLSIGFIPPVPVVRGKRSIDPSKYTDLVRYQNGNRFAEYSFQDDEDPQDDELMG